MTMTRDLCKTIQAEALAALQAVAAKHGLVVSGAGGKYDNVKANLKFEFAAGTRKERAADTFTDYCAIFGFKASDKNREFKFKGVAYRLVGFNPNRPARSCMIERVADQKSFIARPEDVLAAFTVNR